MRNLLYDCYTKGSFVKTVSTYKQAIDWEDSHDDAEYVVRLEARERKLTEKEMKAREERLAKIERMTTVE